jgi:hypothetical protein
MGDIKSDAFKGGMNTMRMFGLILALISLIIVFLNYNIAILLFGTALLFWGLYNLQIKNKITSYIFLASGLVFIVGICMEGFQK